MEVNLIATKPSLTNETTELNLSENLIETVSTEKNKEHQSFRKKLNELMSFSGSSYRTIKTLKNQFHIKIKSCEDICKTLFSKSRINMAT